MLHMSQCPCDLGCHSEVPCDWWRLTLLPEQLSVFYPTGGSAHGKLFPGDQILQMNKELAEDLSCERAVDILRYLPVLRHQPLG